MTVRALIGEAGFGKMFRDLMFPGVAGLVLAIVLGFFELLKGNPAAAADLLKQWGPGFLLGILAIAVVGSFLGQMVDAQKDSVAAQQQVAVALTQVIERDDRERDRMATETAYMCQRVDRTLAIVENLTRQFGRIEARIGMSETDLKGSGG